MPIKQLSPFIFVRGQGLSHKTSSPCLPCLRVCAFPSLGVNRNCCVLGPVSCERVLNSCQALWITLLQQQPYCVWPCPSSASHCHWAVWCQCGDRDPGPVCAGRLRGCQAGLRASVPFPSLFPQVNVMAVSICTREAYQSMKERNIDDGHIININRYARGECGISQGGFQQRNFHFPGWPMDA